MSGMRVGEYLLGERIGSGATATVYRARRGSEEVALKLLHPHVARDEVVRARFLREVAIARSLVHPSIVRVWDLVSWEGWTALVMELCPGGSLVGWRPPGAEEVIRMAREVAGALAAAHARGVIHRDLKPQNLLLDAAGRCKVCDFGSAGVQESVGLTSSSLFLGSPQYVAPEVFAGHPADPRIDLYALGAIIYEAVAGHPPRSPALPVSAGGQAPDRSALDRALPRWLADLLVSLLAPMEQRPRDASSVLRALRRGETCASIELKSCLFCGASIPLASPVCLHCGEEELALHPPPAGAGSFVALRKVTEDASILQKLTELLRAVSGDRSFALSIIIGDVRMYSRQEQKQKTRLPARVADNLSAGDAERLRGILERIKVKATVHPMRAARWVKRGPLVTARSGAVIVPEGADLLARGAVLVPELQEPWMRSLASGLLLSVYGLEARAAAHELRDVVREPLLALRRVAEQAVRDLAASRALTSGVDRADLYAEVSRASLGDEPSAERALAEIDSPAERRTMALEALRRHEEAELEQSRLISRILSVSGLVDELARELSGSDADAAALREALAELESELGPASDAASPGGEACTK